MPLPSKIFVYDQQSRNISKTMQTFYRDQLLTDIALKSKKGKLKVHAHLTVLCASSDYFLETRCNALKKARLDVIELEIDEATLKMVVDFMYSGKIELRWENVARILAAADVLKMRTLKCACSEFIGENIDATNCLSILSMAKQQQSAELHKKAFDFALQNFEEVCKKEEFLQLTEEQLSELISSDDLCVNSEETVFHSVVSWAKYDKGLRDRSMIGLLEHVRFSFLTPEFIISNRQSLSKTCESLMFNWLESHLSRTKCHSARKKAIGKERETLGFVSGQRHSQRRTAIEKETETPGFVRGQRHTQQKRKTPNEEERETLGFVSGQRHSQRRTAIEKETETPGFVRGQRHTQQKRKTPNEEERETLGFVSGQWTDNLKMQSLDPESKFWICENLPPSPTKRFSYRAMVMHEKLIVAGGVIRGGDITNVVECLNLQTKEWINLPPMRQARALPGMAEFNGDLYVVGGNTRLVEKYDFRTGEWQELAPMHRAHSLVKVTVLGKLLYAVGDGRSPIECFNPADNKWTKLPNKREVSTNYGIAGVGGYLYAVGGRHNGQTSKTVERFHPSTKTWTVVGTVLGLALRDLSCVSWNNRLIACRGFDNKGKVQNSVVEYNPEDHDWRTLDALVKHGLDLGSCSLFTFTK